MVVDKNWRGARAVGVAHTPEQEGDASRHEAGQMVGRQTFAQAHRQIERMIVVHLFEGSTHAYQYAISDNLFLSDKLLVKTIMSMM